MKKSMLALATAAVFASSLAQAAFGNEHITAAGAKRRQGHGLWPQIRQQTELAQQHQLEGTQHRLQRL